MTERAPFGSGGFTTRRVFAASRERVWREWTEPERFADWYGGEGYAISTDEIAMDVREGGRWTAVMRGPKDHVIHWDGEYIEVRAPERLSFTVSDQPGAPGQDTWEDGSWKSVNASLTFAATCCASASGSTRIPKTSPRSLGSLPISPSASGPRRAGG